MNDGVVNVVLSVDDDTEVTYVMTDEFGHPIYGYPVE